MDTKHNYYKNKYILEIVIYKVNGNS